MGDGGGGYASGSEGGVRGEWRFELKGTFSIGTSEKSAKIKKEILGLDIISKTRYNNITITRR